MSAAEAPGFTTKNWLSEMDVPAAGPPDHEVPREFCRRAGTKTLYEPVESMYRNGFSRTTGVCPTTVCDGFGKCCGGEFAVPTNTMFHTEPVQLPNSLLRDSHCCCEPETTWPSIFVSA